MEMKMRPQLGLLLGNFDTFLYRKGQLKGNYDKFPMKQTVYDAAKSFFFLFFINYQKGNANYQKLYLESFIIKFYKCKQSQLIMLLQVYHNTILRRYYYCKQNIILLTMWRIKLSTKLFLPWFVIQNLLWALINSNISQNILFIPP